MMYILCHAVSLSHSTYHPCTSVYCACAISVQNFDLNTRTQTHTQTHTHTLSLSLSLTHTQTNKPRQRSVGQKKLSDDVLALTQLHELVVRRCDEDKTHIWGAMLVQVADVREDVGIRAAEMNT